MAPIPPPRFFRDLAEKLYAGVFVVALPWLLPAIVLHDAYEHLRLARLPRPLDARGVERLLARLAEESPVWVTRFVSVVHTIASGEEEVWHVVHVRFADGSEHVVAGVVGPPSLDDAARILATLHPRGGRLHHSSVDEELVLGLPGLAIVYSLLPGLVWAIALALVVAPSASLAVIAPLPIALALHALSRGACQHVMPS